MKHLYLTLCLISIYSFGQQSVEGALVSATASLPLQDIRITNLSSKAFTYSNKDGIFKISVKPNDALAFRSIFIEPYTLTYKNPKQVRTIYLLEKRNLLDEVTVMGTVKFDEKIFNNSLKISLKNDLKQHPELYHKNYGSGGVNLLGLAFLVIDVFVKDKSTEQISYVNIDYTYLIKLFSEENNQYNDRFLSEVLHIDPKDKFLFFDYCDYALYKIPEKDFSDFILSDFLIKQSESYNNLDK